MKLETILQLLYTNGHQELVSRAVQIDNNIPMIYKVGDQIIVEILPSKLPAGKRPKDARPHWVYVAVTIQAVNPYSLTNPYLVIMPNGVEEWVSGTASRSEVSEIVEVETVTAAEVHG